MLCYRSSYPRDRIGCGPRQSAVPVPGSRPARDLRIDLGQTRNRAGHHDAALAQDAGEAGEIRYGVLRRRHRQPVGAGVAMTLGERRQLADRGHRPRKAGVQLGGGLETALASQHSGL